MQRTRQQPPQTDTAPKSEKSAAITLRRFITLEVLMYLCAHIACLGLLLFAPGDVPIFTSRGGGSGILRQHQPRPPLRENTAFDVFRNTLHAGANVPAPHQVSADIIATVLVTFTMNASLIALLRNVLQFLQGESKKEGELVKKDADDKSDADPMAELRQECHEVVKNALMLVSSALCIIIAVGVIAQEPNQVRGVGPGITLMSFVMALCVLQAHGGMEAVVRVVSIYQALLVFALIYFVTQANVFSAGLVQK